MKKIEKLTKKQEALVPVYHKEYLQYGLSTARCDRKKAEKSILALYDFDKAKHPNKFYWFDSPEAMLVFAIAQTKQTISDLLPKVSWGNIEAYWVSFYAFIHDELRPKKEPLVNIAKDIIQECGAFLRFENVCLCSERPVEIHMKDKRLHNPNGPAVRFADGLGTEWRMNNVKMPEAIIMKKASKITKEDITKEKNADVRREIIAKVGNERLLKLLEYKVLDKYKEYELIQFDIGDGRERPFIKMVCPSAKSTIVLGSKPGTTKCLNALAQLFNQERYKLPIQEDMGVNGGDIRDYEVGECLYRHGDVNICKSNFRGPLRAKKLKQGLLHKGENTDHLITRGEYFLDGNKLFVYKDITLGHARHGDMVIPKGNYEIKIHQEYDHWLEESRAVRD